MQEDIRDVCRRFRKNQTKAEKAFWKIVALVTFVRFTLTNKKEYVVSLRKANIISSSQKRGSQILLVDKLNLSTQLRLQVQLANEKT